MLLIFSLTFYFAYIPGSRCCLPFKCKDRFKMQTATSTKRTRVAITYHQRFSYFAFLFHKKETLGCNKICV